VRRQIVVLGERRHLFAGIDISCPEGRKWMSCPYFCRKSSPPSA
jgi:hypothetical protein